MTIIPNIASWDQGGFQQAGFVGFLAAAELAASDLDLVPRVGGVYAVIRPTTHPPVFLPTSPAGRFKGKDPTMAIEKLEARWTPSPILYIGKAGGNQGAASLRTRLRQYLDHGSGLPVGHWGGRLIWQLQDSPTLLFCWTPTAPVEPREVERGLIAAFHTQHQKLPFANLRR